MKYCWGFQFPEIGASPKWAIGGAKFKFRSEVGTMRDESSFAFEIGASPKWAIGGAKFKFRSEVGTMRDESSFAFEIAACAMCVLATPTRRAVPPSHRLHFLQPLILTCQSHL